jgi:hypothetical protein
MNFNKLINSIPGIKPRELSPQAMALAERVKQEKSTSQVTIDAMVAKRKEIQTVILDPEIVSKHFGTKQEILAEIERRKNIQP